MGKISTYLLFTRQKNNSVLPPLQLRLPRTQTPIALVATDGPRLEQREEHAIVIAELNTKFPSTVTSLRALVFLGRRRRNPPTPYPTAKRPPRLPPMPPAKNRHHDDSKSEATAKEKHGGHSATKIRRVASQQGGSNLREVQNASASAKAQPPAEATAPSVRCSRFTPLLSTHGHKTDMVVFYSFNGLPLSETLFTPTAANTASTLPAPSPAHSTRLCSRSPAGSACTLRRCFDARKADRIRSASQWPSENTSTIWASRKTMSLSTSFASSRTKKPPRTTGLNDRPYR